MMRTTQIQKARSTAMMAATICAIASVPHSPTAPYQQSMFPNISVRPVVISASSGQESKRRIASGKYNGSAASSLQALASHSSYPEPSTEIRATTNKEIIIGELRKWGTFLANWDGENAIAPDEGSISLAANFLFALPAHVELPDPMLHANGRVGLYWESNELVADLEFYEDGRITYFIRRAENDKHKGVVIFDKKTFPPLFIALLKNDVKEASWSVASV